MDVQPLMVDRDTALKELRRYQKDRNNLGPMDLEISRIYKAISEGKLVVDALAAIRRAGLGEDRRPKLAIVRADAKRCYLIGRSDGSAVFLSDIRWPTGRTARDKKFEFPAESFVGQRHGDASAIAPHIPPDIRPKRALQSYHILFEAVWSDEPPVDPLLLRRMADDIWLVIAAWELTPVERAVMARHTPPRVG